MLRERSRVRRGRRRDRRLWGGVGVWMERGGVLFEERGFLEAVARRGVLGGGTGECGELLNDVLAVALYGCVVGPQRCSHSFQVLWSSHLAEVVLTAIQLLQESSVVDRNL